MKIQLCIYMLEKDTYKSELGVWKIQALQIVISSTNCLNSHPEVLS